VWAVRSLGRVAGRQLGLTAYPKTSGATAMQIYVPVVPGFTYTQVREFVGRLGHVIRQADPDRVTMEWEIRKRAGKVFIDHNMNRVGANIAAVYSMRPEPGATVSMPLTWKEVEEGAVRAQDFTIGSVWKRLKKTDPFRGVLEKPQDVSGALEAMGIPREDEIPPTKSHRVDQADHGSVPATGKRRGGKSASKSEEAIARSKDPKLGTYLKMRAFRSEEHTS